MDRGPLLLIALAVPFVIVVATLLQRLRKQRPESIDTAIAPASPASTAQGKRRDKFINSFERTRIQAQAVGSKRYRWRTAGDGTVCDYCRAKADKVFAWHHKHEHPGYHQCSDEEICRCYAEPIIPD